MHLGVVHFAVQLRTRFAITPLHKHHRTYVRVFPSDEIDRMAQSGLDRDTGWGEIDVEEWQTWPTTT